MPLYSHDMQPFEWGRRVRSRRIELGIETPTALAATLGVSETTVRRLETGIGFTPARTAAVVLALALPRESYEDTRTALMPIDVLLKEEESVPDPSKGVGA